MELTPAWTTNAALSRYLGEHIDGFRGPIDATPFKGGQSNPTFLVTDANGHRYVLRKKPEGQLLPSAHAVDREFRVMQALEQTDVPVPRMLAFCADSELIGTPFYVMEFVEGRIFWDPALPGLNPAERAAVYADMNRVVAALHTVDYAAVGLERHGPPGQFFERQIRRWTTQYRAAATMEIPAMDRLIEWLPAHMPTSSRTTIFHGDLRIDNLVFHPTQPRVLAVLDWELSTLGDPLADFAHHALAWRLTSSEFRGMAEKDVQALGIPTEEAYLRSYCERIGRELRRVDYEFCVAYSLFRLAAILQGIRKRAIDGTASSQEALETGAKSHAIAVAAWRVAQSSRVGE